MKNVLCYGDSNTWGCVPLTGPEPARRFPPATRWTGVFRRELGEGHWIVEEGLNGRTTVFEDPFQPHRNGRELLLPALLTHRPLDLVVVMLGTNDLKRHLNVTASDIAEGAGRLADVVAASGCGRDEGAPSVLLVCPPPLARLDPLDEVFEGGREKSQQLAGRYAAVAEERGCAFFDAGTVISSSDVDGIHLDEPEHERLGVALAAHVRPLLA